ncbi:MAG: hypothetical protein HKL85_00055 [Acidimicrobiaceae bacterium]|nr:hypothetical protein [Acidimicrobiaceae bacterium]
MTQRIGLSRYASEIRKTGQLTYLAIERFDRTAVDGRVRLRHQEDFSQVLNLDWRDTDVKFQEPAWPGDPKRASVKRIAEALGSIPGGDEHLPEFAYAGGRAPALETSSLAEEVPANCVTSLVDNSVGEDPVSGVAASHTQWPVVRLIEAHVRSHTQGGEFV